MWLSKTVTSLKGVGPKTADNLAKMHLHTFQDVLFHLPFRYEDRTRITPLAELQVGDRVLIEGDVVQATVMGRGKLQLICRLHDGTGAIVLRFFHFNADQLTQLKQTSVRVRCFGEVRAGLHGQLEMMHPEYRFTDQPMVNLQLTDRLTPIYPTTQGVTQPLLRRITQEVLQLLDEQSVPELLPSSVITRYQFASIAQALRLIHEPPVDVDQLALQLGQHPLQQRLAFEELLAHQLSVLQWRDKKQQAQAYVIKPQLSELKKLFLRNLSFQLTKAQTRVMTDIEQDLKNAYPMLRLIQGDVGSGKTVVAALSALPLIESGYQVALMAPTEILAEQHYHTMKMWFTALNIRVGFLVGAQSAKERQQTLEALASGEIQFIVGTHALFQKDVVFKHLALVIIDEQHRFGVQQRSDLHDKGLHADYAPHQLIMTATPIPRTLSMTAYAHLDCSIIDELPPGRKPIETRLVSSARRDAVIERMRALCAAGQQAYWVCTLIDESEVMQCQAASNAVIELQAILPELRIGLLHGRMKSAEKEQIMTDFKAHKIDVLVATTVIEVGIDVPNANLMVIDNAERLGLSQLHQLRGRVGRGEAASYCLLLYKAPLSADAEARLRVMRESSDGFYIAEQDLKLRGPGELLGLRQSGLMQFKVADLLRDQELIATAKDVAARLLVESPETISDLVNRWIARENQTLPP